MRTRLSVLISIVLGFVLSSLGQQPVAPRVVDLTAQDGTKLKASFFPAAKPGPAVMLFHQCNRQRKIWDDLASRLAATGINVMTLDFRGFGESGGGRFNEVPPAEQAQIVQQKWPGDVDAAFNYLVSQPGVKKDVIGAGGASCGVNQSIQLAKRHPEVKSLALLSGGTTADGRQFLRQSKAPMLFAAADDDGGVVGIMQWLMSISGNPGNDFVRYSTGGHGVEMFAPHPELPGKIVDWFKTTLITTPGKAPASAASAALAKDKPVLAVLDEPDGPQRAAKMLEDARKKDPNATLFPEGVVNQLAYERMQGGDTKGAVELAKLNVVAYPNSANAYDSLSDAYLADGQKDLAKQNAEKAVAMLESDKTVNDQVRQAIRDSAQQKLKQLQAEK